MCAGITVFALSIARPGFAEAGGADDPLVPKSYVDGSAALLQTQITTLRDIVTYLQNNSGGAVSAEAGFAPVQLMAGQILMGGEGTEIVLRSGLANAYVTAANGISDLTSAEDLLNGAALSANHYLIVPRNDGRGVIAVTDAWFLVKGPYDIYE